MRRRRFRNSNKSRPSRMATPSALSADWQDEFLRLKDVQGRIDQRRADWAQEEQKYQAGRLLPSYSMDRKYDIFMEPRVPEIAQRSMDPSQQTNEDALVLEDPEEILAQVESAVRSSDDLRATAGSNRRQSRKLLDPDHKRKKRGFFSKVFGGKR